MSKNVLYKTDAQPDWISIANELRSSEDWDPVYWLSSSSIRDQVVGEFPDVTFHDGMDATIGVPPEEHRDHRGRVLDKQILDRYHKYSETVLRMMDRLDPGYAFSYDERVRHYHRLLRYWLDVIDIYSIDIAVFLESPVQPNAYVMYAICKENGIDTPILIRTKIPDLWYVRDDVQGPNQRLCELASRSTPGPTDISDESLAYLDTVSGGHGKVNFRMPDATFRGKLTNIRKFPTYLWKLPQRAGATYKTRGTPIEESRVTWFQYLLQKFDAARYKQRLKWEYRRRYTDVQLSENYIYVPLHYQPEKSTVPDGGAFSSQLLAIDLLSSTVPEHWEIFVKEHPIQFSVERIGERGRASYHYEDIDAIDRTRLVDPSMPSVDLVENANAVATVTGTAGWEAIVGGTPAIVFGNAWYRCCDGVYHVKTKAELEAAVAEIRDGRTVDRADVLSFVGALEDVGYRGYAWKRADVSELSSSENVKNISTAIAQFVEGDQVGDGKRLQHNG